MPVGTRLLPEPSRGTNHQSHEPEPKGSKAGGNKPKGLSRLALDLRLNGAPLPVELDGGDDTVTKANGHEGFKCGAVAGEDATFGGIWYRRACLTDDDGSHPSLHCLIDLGARLLGATRSACLGGVGDQV